MTRRTLTAALISAAGAALMAGALAYGPASHATPDTDGSPPCLAEGTCALLAPATTRYLPLAPTTAAPTTAAQYLPLTPATDGQ
jgi:hypothetical protein